jgi:hypothetical protein
MHSVVGKRGTNIDTKAAAQNDKRGKERHNIDQVSIYRKEKETYSNTQQRRHARAGAPDSTQRWHEDQ